MSTPWNKIKADYLTGTTAKDLSLKYNVKATSIHYKASNEGWTQEKQRITKNVEKIVEQDIKEKIKTYSQKALATLYDIVEDEGSSKHEKINAAKAILDVSGLKSQKIENSGEIDLKNIVINKNPVKKV